MRTRLATGLAVLFIAVFALVAYSHFQYLSDRREARLEDMERVSQTVAATFDGLTHDLESFSLSTAITLGDARVPISQDATPEAQQSVNTYLQHLFDTHGLLRAIFVTDTDGVVVFSQDGNSLGRDISDRPYMQALTGGATEYWSEGIPGLESGEMLVAYGRAIVNPAGETTGYLVLAILTESLASRLPEGLLDEGHISIIDGNGTLILRLPAEGAPLGTNVSDWQALASANGDGTLVRDQEMPFGSDRYSALVGMNNLGWTVSYSLPASAVEGSTTGLFLRDVAILGFIVLFAFVAMWMFASQTIRPISRLTEFAAAIARNDRQVDPTMAESGNAEVSLLADTMAQMQRSIREREEQLRAQTNVIEAIEHFGEAIASELDLQRAVTAITHAGVELVDADLAQIVSLDTSDVPSVTAGPRPALALTHDSRLVQKVLDSRTVEVEHFPTANSSNGDGGMSAIGIPLRGGAGSVEAALILLREPPMSFNNLDLRLAEGLGRWASIVLDNARLFARSQELIAELEESNQAKKDFLGIVSHELRTPITTIYGGTLLLRLRRESLPEQAFTDMLVSISDEAERLHHLVQDLLTIARTELVVQPRPIDLGETLQTTVAEFMTTHKRPVSVQLEAELPEALGDATYVRQVITNLISNADKYTPAGAPIEITAANQGGEIVVRVRDNGDGIDEEDMPQVFESFYRAKTAAERASGSGLGLTVCRRLIESLNGRIWAQNRPEGGLEVSFTLNVAQSADGGGDPDGGSAANPNGRAEHANGSRANGAVPGATEVL
jgi:signal transduction histidine kinase